MSRLHTSVYFDVYDVWLRSFALNRRKLTHHCVIMSVSIMSIMMSIIKEENCTFCHNGYPQDRCEWPTLRKSSFFVYYLVMFSQFVVHAKKTEKRKLFSLNEPRLSINLRWYSLAVLLLRRVDRLRTEKVKKLKKEKKELDWFFFYKNIWRKCQQFVYFGFIINITI